MLVENIADTVTDKDHRVDLSTTGRKKVRVGRGRQEKHDRIAGSCRPTITGDTDMLA